MTNDKNKASLFIFLIIKTRIKPINAPNPKVGKIARKVPKAKPKAAECDEPFNVATSFSLSLNPSFIIGRRHQESNLGAPKGMDFWVHKGNPLFSNPLQ